MVFGIRCIFSLDIIFIITQIPYVALLPTLTKTDIINVEKAIRLTTNTIFHTLGSKRLQEIPRLHRKALVYNYFITITLQGSAYLKEIVKLTRADKSNNSKENSTNFIALINEILSEEKVFRLKNLKTGEKRRKEYDIEAEMEKLDQLKKYHAEKNIKRDNEVLKILHVESLKAVHTNDSHQRNANAIQSQFWNVSKVPNIERRIFKGKRTKIKEYPFMASVQIFNRFQCAGSIIKSDLVITAASCLQLAWNNRFYRENPAFLSVRIGTSFYETGGETIQVLEIHFHPEYNPQMLQNNIAIMRLLKKIKFKKNKVKKIKIAASIPKNGGIVEVIGWGAHTISNKLLGAYEDKMKRAELHMYYYQDCQEIYSKGYVHKHKNFCAGFITAGAGACNRDVGGPGIIAGQLAGVISFGAPVCGLPDNPTVFTTLPYYADWIQEIMDQPVVVHKKRTTMKPSTYLIDNDNDKFVTWFVSPVPQNRPRGMPNIPATGPPAFKIEQAKEFLKEGQLAEPSYETDSHEYSINEPPEQKDKKSKEEDKFALSPKTKKLGYEIPGIQNQKESALSNTKVKTKELFKQLVSLEDSTSEDNKDTRKLLKQLMLTADSDDSDEIKGKKFKSTATQNESKSGATTSKPESTEQTKKATLRIKAIHEDITPSVTSKLIFFKKDLTVGKNMKIINHKSISQVLPQKTNLTQMKTTERSQIKLNINNPLQKKSSVMPQVLDESDAEALSSIETEEEEETYYIEGSKEVQKTSSLFASDELSKQSDEESESSDDPAQLEIDTKILNQKQSLNNQNGPLTVNYKAQQSIISQTNGENETKIIFEKNDNIRKPWIQLKQFTQIPEINVSTMHTSNITNIKYYNEGLNIDFNNVRTPVNWQSQKKIQADSPIAHIRTTSNAQNIQIFPIFAHEKGGKKSTEGQNLKIKNYQNTKVQKNPTPSLKVNEKDEKDSDDVPVLEADPTKNSSTIPIETQQKNEEIEGKIRKIPIIRDNKETNGTIRENSNVQNTKQPKEFKKPQEKMQPEYQIISKKMKARLMNLLKKNVQKTVRSLLTTSTNKKRKKSSIDRLEKRAIAKFLNHVLNKSKKRGQSTQPSEDSHFENIKTHAERLAESLSKIRNTHKTQFQREQFDKLIQLFKLMYKLEEQYGSNKKARFERYIEYFRKYRDSVDSIDLESNSESND